MTEEQALVPQPESRDIVHDEELNGTPGEWTFTAPEGDDGEGEPTHLLDPLKAQEQEAERYRRAPKRHRMTADDLDRLTGMGD